ncbi:hypothetical protein PO909_008583 [Leuciscus waleckii]
MNEGLTGLEQHEGYWGKDVLVRMYNTATVVYINRQGGLCSHRMSQLARHPLLWSQKHLRSLRAIHVPGLLNHVADELSRAALLGVWRLHPQVVQLIWCCFGAAQGPGGKSASAAPGGGRPSPSFALSRSLSRYIDRTQSFRTSDQLFVCYGGQQNGKAFSKQRMAHWTVDAYAYKAQGVPCPLRTSVNQLNPITNTACFLQPQEVNRVHGQTAA